MTMITTITSKFQVNIPAKARKLAGLKKHGLAEVEVKNGNFIIKPIKDDILSLAGKFKVKNPIPVEKIRDYIDYSDL